MQNQRRKSQHYYGKDISDQANPWRPALKGDPFFLEMADDKSSNAPNDAHSLTNTGLHSVQSGYNRTPSALTVHTVVQIKSLPGSRGIVEDVIDRQGETVFRVFVNGRVKTFYRSQLAFPMEDEESPLVVKSVEEFHAHLTAEAAREPEDHSAISLTDACLDFVPEQIGAISSFLKTPNQRFLVATHTGSGKTVVAGMAARELMCRQNLEKILIICPRSLVVEGKIQREMKRLDLDFTCPTRRELLHCIRDMHKGRAWNPEWSKIIIPYTYLDDELLHGCETENPTNGLLDLELPPLFDLVIVDESHHVRNSRTCQYQAVEFICRDALSVLYLSASPVQLGDRDLYTILTALGSDPGMGRKKFSEMMNAVPHINRAKHEAIVAGPGWRKQALDHLAAAVRTAWGQNVLQHYPKFDQTIAILKADGPGDRDRVKIITDLEALSPLSSSMCSGQGHGADNHTVRKAITVNVAHTPEQREFHDDLIKLHTRLMAWLYGENYADFFGTILCEQAASCINGLAPKVEEILHRQLEKIRLVQKSDISAADGDDYVTFKVEINNLVERAETLADEDPKLNRLLDIVRQRLAEYGGRVMVYSRFRHTIKYLHDQLRQHGMAVGVINGDVRDCQRVEVKERFSSQSNDHTSIQILLTSNVCSEGLDYEFCDTLVNYDLLWNPIVIDQRIGRIDRRGQKSGAVLVYNLVTPGTIDDKMYNRCRERVKVFEDSVRMCKPILGDRRSAVGSLRAERQLTDSEMDDLHRAQKDARTANAALINDLRGEAFAGLDLPISEDQVERGATTAPWLAPDAINNLLVMYLSSLDNGDGYTIHGMGEIKTLCLSGDLRKQLLQDSKKSGFPDTEAMRQWRRWLQGESDRLRVTFAARTHSTADLHFLGPEHQLIKQAAAYVNYDSRRINVMLSTCDDEIPTGQYPFAVYRWIFRGIRSHIDIVPVCNSDSVQPRLTQLLLSATVNDPLQAPGLRYCDRTCDEMHRRLWKKAMRWHESKSSTLADKLIADLDASHTARKHLLDGRCAQPGISDDAREMYNSKLRDIATDYECRRDEILSKFNRADIDFECIAVGILQVSDSFAAATSTTSLSTRHSVSQRTAHRAA